MKKLTPVNYFVLFLATFFFIAPLISAAEFSMRGDRGIGHNFQNYTWIVHQLGFADALFTSLRLAAITAVIVLVLVVPTVVYVNLSGQRYKRLIEFLCLIPIIVPVVSIAIGAEVSMPKTLQSTSYELCFFYVVVSLPYVYRTLDIGLQSIPLATLVEASRSLGGNWIKTFIYVIVPAVRTATLGALFITIALSLGEYTLAVLLHFHTFPTWVTNVSQQNIRGSVALSVVTLLGAWILLAFFAFGSKFKAIFTRSQMGIASDE